MSEEQNNIKEYGTVNSDGIEIVTIIGEIEGHQNLGRDSKTTSYEHMLPMLASYERNTGVKGILYLINTIGGDVSCGLSMAEMIAGLSKPSVSLIIGDSHSIGLPIAAAADYSFIVPRAKMMMETSMMAKDLGTILVGQEAVDVGLVNQCGSISDALDKLSGMIRK